MKKIVISLLTIALIVAFCTAALAAGYVFALTGSTKIRTGPGLGYSEIGTLFQGDSAPYLGDTSYDSRGVAWYRISCGGGSGWVSSRYTTLNGAYDTAPAPAPAPVPAPAPAYGGTVFAEGGSTKVRTGPGLGYAEIGTLFQGDSATYLGDTSVDGRGVPWYRISWEGGSGWVSSRYTTLY